MPTTNPGPRQDLDLDRVRTLLADERRRLEDELHRIHEQDAQGGSAGELHELSNYSQHPADQGTDTFFHEQDFAIEADLETELKQVLAAQRKLDAGTYGYCDRCGTKIPAARLEALPFAIYCVPCAAEVEPID